MGSSPSTSAPLVYDAADGYVLTVAVELNGTGANASFGPYLETWAFSGGNWTRLDPIVSPPNRFASSLVYDPVAGEVILFGGIRFFPGPLGTSVAVVNDTWGFANGTWTNLTGSTIAAPPARGGASFAWDANDSCGVLFGGWTPMNFTDTWCYTTGRWTLEIPGPSGPPVSGGALAADPILGGVVYYGGQYRTTAYPSADTWVYEGGNWTNITDQIAGSPGGLWEPSLSADPALGGIVLFGGAVRTTQWLVTNDTWFYNGTSWTPLASSSPVPPRMDAGLAWDAADRGLVLYGGYNLTTNFFDTWFLNVTQNWSQSDPILTVSRTLTEVGVPVTVATRSQFQSGEVNYSYSGLPAGCVPASGVQFQCTPRTSGNYSIEVDLSVAGSIALARTALQVAPNPMIGAWTATRTTLDLGQSTTLQLHVDGGVAPLSYTYRSLPTGCASANTSQVDCQPTATGVSMVDASVTDALGVTVTSRLNLTVNPTLSIRSVTASAPSVPQGGSVTLTLSVDGGTPPYVIRVSGLPGVCQSVMPTSVECVPNDTGTFLVTATVTDGVAVSAEKSVTVVVVPPGAGPSSGPDGWTALGHLGSFAAGAVVGVSGLLAAATWLLLRRRRERDGARLREQLDQFAHRSDVSEEEPASGYRRGAG